MLLILAWVIAVNLALYCWYRRARRKRRSELIRRQVEDSLRVETIEIGPKTVLELREIIQR